MVEPLEQLTNTLKRHDQSLTRPRRLIFEALQDKEPQTIAEVVKACPSIDRASVYRTITLFEKLGITQRLQIGWKYKLELSDSFHHHHHHLTCTNCGVVIPFDEDPGLEIRLNNLARGKGFQMRGHQLEIQGLCEKCQKT